MDSILSTIANIEHLANHANNAVRHVKQLHDTSSNKGQLGTTKDIAAAVDIFGNSAVQWLDLLEKLDDRAVNEDMGCGVNHIIFGRTALKE